MALAWKCPEGRFDGTLRVINMNIKPNGVLGVFVPALRRMILLNPLHSKIRQEVQQVGMSVCLVVAGNRKWIEPQQPVDTPAQAA